MPSRLHRRTLKKRYEQFCRVVRKCDARTMVRLIRRHPELHADPGNAGAWVDVVDSGAPELLELAFQAGLHPDAGQAGSAMTLLQGAVANGDLLKVRLALRYGADPELRNDWGEVALGYACSWGQFEAARALVEAGADVNAIEDNPETGYRCTPLDSTRQYPEIAEYLRARGARYLHELETLPAGRGDEASAAGE